VFATQDDDIPMVVAQTSRHWTPNTIEAIDNILLLEGPQFKVLYQSSLLCTAEQSDPTFPAIGILKKIRIISITRGLDKHKKSLHMYEGPLVDLTFDSGRWRGPDNQSLHTYMAKRG
jgi:hypothetical protein